jgi:7-carboxy-7-deazaguanine synthase
MIPVLEIFGKTIQGEGVLIGQPTMFVRTAGCDYNCRWCDSKFTWDGSEKPKMLSPKEILSELKGLDDNFQHVTISGGNPALIGKPMGEFIDLLHKNRIQVAIETQGSKFQEWFKEVDTLTLSPKPPSSGMNTNFEMLNYIINNVPQGNVNLKVVVFDDYDFEYAKQIHKLHPNIPFNVQVGNDDVNSNHDIAIRLLQKFEWLTNKVINDNEMNKVRVLPQLHALIWGNKRGV